jgi:hypothetical protein
MEYPDHLTAPSRIPFTAYAWRFPIGQVEILVWSSASVMTLDPELDMSSYAIGGDDYQTAN